MRGFERIVDEYIENCRKKKVGVDLIVPFMIIDRLTSIADHLGILSLSERDKWGVC